MFDRQFRAIAAFALRHERAIAVIGTGWFALNCADVSGFIDLPRIPFITGATAFWISGLWTALWWSWIYGAIEDRKAELRDAAAAKEVEDGTP